MPEEALWEHLDAISARDIGAFAHTLHENVRLVGPGGSIIEGRENAVAAHLAWFQESEWTFEPAVVFGGERGDAAWWLLSVNYNSPAEAKHFLLYVLFVRSEEGRWQLIYDQNTTVAPRTG